MFVDMDYSDFNISDVYAVPMNGLPVSALLPLSLTLM